MTPTPPIPAADPLADPVRNALLTLQRPLAQIHGRARKYPAEIAPFAALDDLSPAAADDLLALLAPAEATWLFHALPPLPAGLTHQTSITCLQMAFPPGAPLPPSSAAAIRPLSCADAPAMVALTEIAFPGFFRSRTCVMGAYFGIHDAHGTLIALGGERQRMTCPPHPAPQPGTTPWIEISAICTHPGHRGHGHAAALITHLLHLHSRAHAVSCLHVSTTNARAIALYHRLGFQTLRSVELHSVRCAP